MQPPTQISPETLRDWLEQKKPVKIIDIRPEADYNDWHISEADNIDVYHQIGRGSPGQLAELTPAEGIPLVTVCYVGQTSKLAAQYLASRGIDSYSLTGGMQWWSLAWNSAEMKLENTQTRVIQIRRSGKGCLSYIIGSVNEAVVIDPSVSSEVYANIAKENGWQIKHILDTHIHADHLTRGLVLAKETDATYYLPEQDRAKFEYVSLKDNQIIGFGDSKIKAIHSPGHTIESMTFLLDDQILFSGDTVFPNGMGRPDLESSDPDEIKTHSRHLYKSLQNIKNYKNNLILLAGHTSKPVPFDDNPIFADVKETLNKIELLNLDEDGFVNDIVKRIPPTPPNYLNILYFNQAGIYPDGDVTTLEAGPNRCAI
ncbi:MAG: MBL fold metallo-hydrolase [Chloroflexota bacterium]